MTIYLIFSRWWWRWIGGGGATRRRHKMLRMYFVSRLRFLNCLSCWNSSQVNYEVSFFWGCALSLNLISYLAWNAVAMSGLLILVAIEIYWTRWRNEFVGPHLPVYLKTWAHCQNMVRISHFISISLDDLVEMIILLYSCGRSTRYSNRLQDFSVSIPRFYKDVLANHLFICTAKRNNFLLIEFSGVFWSKRL